LGDQFTYGGGAPPNVFAISPTAGPLEGRISVTITGTNFAGTPVVSFGPSRATVTSFSTTQIVAVCPPEGSGAVDVTVTTALGTSATSGADQFTFVRAPIVTAISPLSGTNAGGTQVTITGSGFTTATAVQFGGKPAAFVIDSDSQITATSPAGLLGIVDVTVTTAGGFSATVPADQFTYQGPAPIITAITPVAGPSAGGTTVTIMGANLAGATAVYFGSTLAAKWTWTSIMPDQIMATSPAGGTGVVDITVVTPAGRSATSSADQFTFVPSQGATTNLSAVSGSGVFGGTATLTSKLTAGGVPLAGRIVTFTLSEGGTVQTMGAAITDANGVATLTGVSLAGLNSGTYPGAVGASFAGDSSYAGSSASGPLVVNATTPPQSPPVIIGEQPLFRRKTNKKGKPIGRPVLSGFVFDFSDPLNPSSATNGGNYQVDTITTKRVKKQTRRILHPITSFSVAYSAVSDSVTLTFPVQQTFKTGGQITVVAGPPSGVVGASGAALAGSTVFMISPRGQSIVAQ
jgi:hypothetical protein